jgi:hypothetical protein
MNYYSSLDGKFTIPNVSYLLRDGFVVVAVEQNRGKKKDLH